jgi:hypothetical protein
LNSRAEGERGTQIPSPTSEMLTSSGKGNRAAESDAESRRKEAIFSPAFHQLQEREKRKKKYGSFPKFKKKISKSPPHKHTKKKISPRYISFYVDSLSFSESLLLFNEEVKPPKRKGIQKSE